MHFGHNNILFSLNVQNDAVKNKYQIKELIQDHEKLLLQERKK
jgi:hypothetical protein